MERKFLNNILKYFNINCGIIELTDWDNIGIEYSIFETFYFKVDYNFFNKIKTLNAYNIFKIYFEAYNIELNDINLRIFSYLHEIGHLFHKENFYNLNAGNLAISNYHLTSLDEIEYRSLDREQFADVFALEYMEQNLEELREVMLNGE